jgi:uracil-DNA glycosylase family 4
MSASTPKDLSFKEIAELPREQRREYFGKKYLVPLDHPAMPAAGPDFARTVHELVDIKVAPKLPRDSLAMSGVDYIYRSALYKRNWKLQVAFKGEIRTIEFLPGGLWILPEAFDTKNSSRDMLDYEWFGHRPVGGPRAIADVMIIGKHPGVEELDKGQNFIGPSSSDLHRALRDLKVKPETRHGWYVTNTVKHNRLDPTSGTMQQSWLKNCAPLLYQEILLVRPKFIACLGTEAIKAVLGKDYTVGNMKSRVIDLTFRVPPATATTHVDYDDLDSYVDHKVSVMGIPHPAYIFRMPEAYPDLHGGLELFINMVGGERPIDVEKDKRHTPVYTTEKLGDIVDRIIENARDNWDFEVDGDLPIAWDAEWHGRQPGDAGSYLRTIQFAAGYSYKDAPKRATCVVLTEKGGTVNGWFHSRDEITSQLRRLIAGQHSDGGPPIKTRHGGHFFKADIPWIRHFLGIDFGPLWVTLPPLPPVKYLDDAGKEQEREQLVKRFNGIKYCKALGARELRRLDHKTKQQKLPKKERTEFTEPLPDRDAVDEKGLPIYRDQPHHQYELTRYTGGFDTGYMTHAVFEAVESFDLEQLALRWTTCPRWSTGVEQAKVQIAKEMGIKLRDLGGYGDILDDHLLGYALYDADATLRLFWRLNFARTLNDGDGFLDQDVKHHNSREAFWRTMLAGPTFLEMEETGVTVDVERGKELIKVFEMAKERLTTSLRDQLGWPTFNPNSAPQTRALLFGEAFSGMVDKKTGAPKRVLPEGFDEKGFGLDPIKTTGKPSRAWANIRDNERKLYTPAVDKEVLGIYAHENDQIKQLRDIRYIRQVLQSVLRPPKVGEPIGADSASGMVYDELDEFDGGFLSYVSPTDGRVRSRFYPVETGRCSSAGPNLQNLAKRREDDYARILGHCDDEGKLVGDYLAILGGTLYNDPIRSIVTAGDWDGEPTVLMEFDIISAEIAALAWESGDAQMIEDVNRAMLPEDDPNFLDIHSSTAVEAFKLDCAPTKKALKALGKPGLRVAAKNVRFGVPYGRSAEALSRQCQEEGAKVSVADCQKLIDNYKKRYPAASDFLDACENRVYGKENSSMVGAFGRRRRFQPVDDKSVMADQGRSAKNFPIQNLVADAILMGMYNILHEREVNGLQGAFRVVLQIHDAIMLEVKIPFIEEVRRVVTHAMTAMVPITPRDLVDGVPMEGEVYHFNVDCSVFLNWGQSIDPERGRFLGIPEEYLGGK